MLDFLKKFQFWGLALLCAFVLGIGGCAAAQAVGDFVFGYTPPVPTAPGTPPQPGGASDFSLFDGLMSLLSVLFPWGAGVAGIGGGIRWAYIEARKRNLDGLFKAVVIGIKDAVDAAKDGHLDKDALYNSIQGARELYANRELFDKLVDEIKRGYDEAKAATK
jgi:hypothetical protein